MTLATAEGHELGEPTTTTMTASDYWAGVPVRLRDASRFVVERIIQLQLGKKAPLVDVTVRRIDADVIVWKSPTPKA